MLYIIQVSVYTAAMLLIYALFLRNRGTHAFARYYLLLCAVLPFLLPLIRLPQEFGWQFQQVTGFKMTLPELVVGSNAALNMSAGINWVILLYLLVVTILLMRQIINVAAIARLVSKNPKKTVNGYTLVTHCGYGPGSFANYIFFPGGEVNETILKHEEAHTKMHHTLDVLLVNLILVLAWPNVFLQIIKTELKQVHEFQADASVATDSNDYARLLLGSVFNVPSIPIMHLFIIHPIKRRIMMLQKKNQGSPARPIMQVSLSMMLLVGAAMAVQSCSKHVPGDTAVVSTNTQKLSVQVWPDNKNVVTKDEIKNLEKQPSYSDLSYLLTTELKYPESARKNGVQGRVIIQFVVNSNGDAINPRIVRSPDTVLSTEALRVFGKMNKWEPGVMKGKKVDVEMTLPILFKLDN